MNNATFEGIPGIHMPCGEKRHYSFLFLFSNEDITWTAITLSYRFRKITKIIKPFKLNNSKTTARLTFIENLSKTQHRKLTAYLQARHRDSIVRISQGRLCKNHWKLTLDKDLKIHVYAHGKIITYKGSYSQILTDQRWLWKLAIAVELHLPQLQDDLHAC